MTMNNPYNAPQADVEVYDEGNGYENNMFTLQGRIGRMRYFVYSFVMQLIMQVAMIPVMLVAALLGVGAAAGANAVAGDVGMSVVGAFVMVIVYALLLAAGIWVMLATAGRRCHDINLSRWWLLWMIVPIANLIFLLFLLFKGGSQDDNRWGPQPSANPQWVKVVFWIAIGLMVLSFVLVFAMFGVIFAALAGQAY